MEFGIPGDHRVKLKESEKRDRFIDLDRELIKTTEHDETVILIVIVYLGTVTIGFIQL